MVLNKIISQPKTWPRPTWQTLTLNGRNDFPALSGFCNVGRLCRNTIADEVGLFKEIEGSRGGSGFSFNGIAADRAGTRMGELTIGNEQREKKIQMLMGDGKRKRYYAGNSRFTRVYDGD